jgi:hypothetical protein
VEAPCASVDKLLLLVSNQAQSRALGFPSLFVPQDCFDPGLAYSEMPQPLSDMPAFVQQEEQVSAAVRVFISTFVDADFAKQVQAQEFLNIWESGGF